MRYFAIGLGLVAIALLVNSTAVRAVAQQATATEQFLAKALEANANEMDVTEKAAKQANRPEVRKFAQELYNDHKKLNGELMALASNAKIAIATGVSKDHAEMTVRMLTLKGDEFDAAFLKHIIDDHEKCIKVFETEGLKLTSEPVRAFVERTLPTMRKHLEEARQLAKAERE